MTSLLFSVAFATNLGHIPVQGVLSDAAGAHPTGSVALTFTLALDGQVVHTEQQTVLTDLGLFSARLGGAAGLDLGLISGPGALTLSVTVGGETSAAVPVDFAPRAAWAADAGRLGGELPDHFATTDASSLTTGTLDDARLSPAVVVADPTTGEWPGVIVLDNPANTFAGNGAGLTDLSAAAIVGSLPATALPSHASLVGLTLGNDVSTACGGGQGAGSLRWNGTAFQGCDGAGWQVLGTSGGGGGGGGTTPTYDAYTALVHHFDGANGATLFADATGRHIPSRNGNASLSTTNAKFGASSLYLDGVGDWLAYGDVPDFEFGTGDFTIEMWVRSPAANRPGGGAYHSLYSTWDGATGLWLHVNASGGITWGNTGAPTHGTRVVYDDAWHHVAFTRSNGTGRLFVDGILDGTLSMAGSSDTNMPMYIGEIQSLGRYPKAWIDEVRISKGIARYTANFTPPTAAF